VDLSTPASAASSEVLIIVVDPALAKRLPIENAQVGDAITFFLTVTNPNSASVSGVSVDDPLPSLVDFVSATMTQGTFSYNPASHTVTFNIGTMAAGQVVEISVGVKVNEQGKPPTTMRNKAQLRVNGQLRAMSNEACAEVLPGAIPGTGVGPGARIPADDVAVGVCVGFAVRCVAGLETVAQESVKRGALIAVRYPLFLRIDLKRRAGLIPSAPRIYHAHGYDECLIGSDGRQGEAQARAACAVGEGESDFFGVAV